MLQLNETDTAEASGDKDSAISDVKAIIDKLQNRKNIYEQYIVEMNTSGETQKSLTDSDARLMKDSKGFDVSYNVQTSVDSKHKLIAEFNVTNDGNDMKQLHDMAKSTAEILEAPDITAVADTGYNNASEIARCIEAGITAHIAGSEGSYCIPCESNEAEEITAHENGKAVYIKERNIAICPMGKILYPSFYYNSS